MLLNTTTLELNAWICYHILSVSTPGRRGRPARVIGVGRAFAAWAGDAWDRPPADRDVWLQPAADQDHDENLGLDPLAEVILQCQYDNMNDYAMI